MFIQNNTDYKVQDRKIAAVAYLRESAEANKHRLVQVKSILSGEDQVPYNVLAQKEKATIDSTMLSSEKTNVSSFRNRFIFCIILFGLFFAGTKSNDNHISSYVQDIKSAISVDYSDNLFDFFRQIPYTFDYEKINVK